MAKPPRLKLRARDAADMDVIASVLQDALVPLTECSFLRRERRFVMVVNRFMWERAEEAERAAAARADGSAAPAAPAPDGADAEDAEEEGDAAFHEAGPRPTYYRSHCGVTFDKVEEVRIRGVDQADRNQILNLLTIATEPKRIELHFSDGGRILLAVSAVRCHLQDFDEPWPTWSRPGHERSGQERSGQERSGQEPSGQERSGDEAPPPDLDGAKPAR